MVRITDSYCFSGGKNSSIGAGKTVVGDKVMRPALIANLPNRIFRDSGHLS